ncbi:MAG: LuxR C-terminal-related transcriptional regulator [Bacteroidota bacterium]
MIPGRRLPDAPTEKITQEPWTSKQVEVLRLLAQGPSNNEIAAQMMVSYAT